MSTIGVGHADRPGSRAVSVSSPNYPAGTIPDLGLAYYGDPVNRSNKNSYGTVGGAYGYEDTWGTLPGRALSYATGTGAYGIPPSVDEVTARANGWLVHDNAGNEVTYFGTVKLANCGHSGFQNQWKSNVLAYLAAHPTLDGMFIDNFQTRLQDFSGVGYPIKDQSNNVIWSSDADFQTAQLSFAANAHLALKNAGYIVEPNGAVSLDTDASLTVGWVDRYYTYFTGMTTEYWLQAPGDTSLLYTASSPFDGNYTHAWNEWMAVMDHVQSVGLDFYPICYTNSTAVARSRFFRASFLMNWNGGKGAVLLSDDNAADPWSSAFAFDPGRPTGSKVYMGVTGCWKRTYERYTVYVNANPSTQTLDGHSIASGDGMFV